ncbi:MAG: alanine racemase [Betaproteobacteria bacterium]|nr:alanine racemase [Betaproteobacteria bacterium]
MTRPIRACIDLAALRHNLGVVRAHAPKSKTLAVVKADAYGHGLLRAARALEGADGFALLNIEDALRLRESGITKPIVLLEGFFARDELALIEAQRLTPVVHHREQVKMLSGAALRSGVDVLLKLNTGMNRLGFPADEFAPALKALVDLPAVNEIILMTHFAGADERDGVAAQLECFNRATAGTARARSLANSAAILSYPETHADWVRPGIMLYGSSPFADRTAAQLGLEPVMTLESEIIAVQELTAGDRVGYGGTFTADKPMRVGTVACGYADGYPRHCGTGTPILVNGRHTRTLGRVSMDMLCADLAGIPDAAVGSRVTLWGRGLPVEEVAGAGGTISYELLCAVTPRVPVVEEHG